MIEFSFHLSHTQQKNGFITLVNPFFLSVDFMYKVKFMDRSSICKFLTLIFTVENVSFRLC